MDIMKSYADFDLFEKKCAESMANWKKVLQSDVDKGKTLSIVEDAEKFANAVAMFKAVRHMNYLAYHAFMDKVSFDEFLKREFAPLRDEVVDNAVNGASHKYQHAANCSLYEIFKYSIEALGQNSEQVVVN